MTTQFFNSLEGRRRPVGHGRGRKPCTSKSLCIESLESRALFSATSPSPSFAEVSVASPADCAALAPAAYSSCPVTTLAFIGRWTSDVAGNVPSHASSPLGAKAASTFLGLHDAALAALTQSLYSRDGSITRNDMIQILESTGYDDGVVDAAELSDLRTILADASTLKIPGYVQVLAGDVVAGNAANATYQGYAMGNLRAGSSVTQLDHLVNKWFLGADHPVTGGYQYVAAAGTLFGSSTPSHYDEHQGALGDCYFISSLGAIADSSPAAIRNMFIDNGVSNGVHTWTVRFYVNGRADYVTVDNLLPVDSLGNFVFQGIGVRAGNAGNSLWIALAEKAYAEWDQTGNEGRGGKNSYVDIQGGWMANVDAQVLGHAAPSYALQTNSDRQTLINALTNHMAVTIGTDSSSRSDDSLSYGLYGSHAYAVTGYNSRTGTFTLYNPWGNHQPAALTWSQLRQTCCGFVVANTYTATAGQVYRPTAREAAVDALFAGASRKELFAPAPTACQ